MSEIEQTNSEELGLPFLDLQKMKSCDECGLECELRNKGNRFRVKTCDVAIVRDFVTIKKCNDDLGCRECPDPTGKGCNNKIIGTIWEKSNRLANPWEFPKDAIYCKICDERNITKTFRSKGSLTRHINTKHNEPVKEKGQGRLIKPGKPPKPAGKKLDKEIKPLDHIGIATGKVPKPSVGKVMVDMLVQIRDILSEIRYELDNIHTQINWIMPPEQKQKMQEARESLRKLEKSKE